MLQWLRGGVAEKGVARVGVRLRTMKLRDDARLGLLNDIVVPLHLLLYPLGLIPRGKVARVPGAPLAELGAALRGVAVRGPRSLRILDLCYDAFQDLVGVLSFDSLVPTGLPPFLLC